MQYRASLSATDELGLDDGVNAVGVATVDSIKNSLSEDKDKQEDKSNKDEFTIASVYNENRQARGDVGKVREDDSKTNKLNNAGDLDAKENDKLVKEVSKELSGAEAALYNDENTDAKKQNYKGMYDGEENKVYVNTDKTDITDAGEYVNLVYHENRHAQKTQDGIENTADQEELVTHYGDRAEKLWGDANKREGKTTGGTTQKTISEWRQENNANYPSVFKNSEASQVENEQPFCGTGLCLAAGYAVGNILAGLIGYGGTKAAIKTADKINESATGEKGAIDNEKVNHDVNSAFTAIGALKAGEATFVGGVGTGSYFVSNYYSLSTLFPATAEFTESLIVTGPPEPTKASWIGYLTSKANEHIIQPYVVPKVKEQIKKAKETLDYKE